MQLRTTTTCRCGGRPPGNGCCCGIAGCGAVHGASASCMHCARVVWQCAQYVKRTTHQSGAVYLPMCTYIQVHASTGQVSTGQAVQDSAHQVSTGQYRPVRTTPLVSVPCCIWRSTLGCTGRHQRDAGVCSADCSAVCVPYPRTYSPVRVSTPRADLHVQACTDLVCTGLYWPVLGYRDTWQV